jgi:DNA (cytosine-5)-methyltransferase 1
LHSCETLRLNGFEHVVHAPINEISSAEISKCCGQDLDVLIGGPPCQPFSKSGYWTNGDTRRLKDPRADTLVSYFRCVEDLQPHAFLLENVHGINYSGKEEGFTYILKAIEQINRRKGTQYEPTWQVVNAADYGVPQLRVRFFLIAFRDGTPFTFPAPTHRSPDETAQRTLFSSDTHCHVRAWDALRHTKPDANESLAVGGKWADLLPSIPEGENYLWHTDRKDGLPLFGWRTRYWSFLLKLAKSKPSWTIQAQPGSAIGPFHWDNRRLSWREMAALQTFPKSFQISCPRVEIQRQIGNAVPSLLAEHFARRIKSCLRKRSEDKPLALRIPPARDLPPPEPVSDVPKKYLDLIGVHPAHPGTGKGRRYQTSGLTDR